MPFENSNDIEINVKLNAEQAQNELRQLGSETDKFTKNTTIASAGVNFLGGALAGLAANISVELVKSLAELGDKLDDVRDGFNQAVSDAGGFSNEVLSNLNAATKNAVTNLDLMAAASKGLQLGIAVEQLDDLAFAAQKAADKFGGDALQEFEKLTRAISRGNEEQLKLYGTLKNGKFVIDEFTGAQDAAGTATESAADAIARLEKTLSDNAAEFASFINNSKALAISLAAANNILLEFIAGLKTLYGLVPKLSTVLESLANIPIVGQFARSAAVTAKLTEELQPLINWMDQVDGSAKEAATGVTAFDVATDKAGKKVKSFEERLQELKQITDDFRINLNDIFGNESFTFDDGGSLRDSIRKAFQSSDVVGELRKAAAVFADGVIDPKVLQERFKVFLKEVSLVNDEFEKLGEGFADQIEAEAEAASAALEKLGDDLLTVASATIDIINSVMSGDFFAKGNFAASGGQIGQLIAGPIGAQIGQIIGSVAELFTSDDGAGTKARKAADKYFADIFDANRLAVVVGDQVKLISDLVFKGDTPFGGNSDFASGTFDDLLSTLPANVQAGLKGVGTAFEELLGIGEDVAGQLAAVFANNVGGELNNLQLLVEATGESFETLHNAVVEAFLDGKLSIEEAQIALEGLQQVSEAGIPGAIGAIDQAFRNLQATVTSGKGSRALADAIRDIGVEAQELGIRDFPTLANRLVQVFGFSAQQVAAFFQAMKATGINSLQELADASTEVATALARNIQLIQQGKDPNATPVILPDTSASTKSSVPSSPKLSEAQKKAEEIKRQREQERKKLIQDALKLVQSSEEYEKVLRDLQRGTISQSAASKALNDLYSKAHGLLTDLAKAQDTYNKALQKGKATADQAKAVKELQEQLDKLFEKAEKLAETKNLDFLAAFANNLNIVGLAARELGVTLEDTEEKIVNAFKAGKTSISQANDELEKARDLLTNGIPGATGATSDAFNNLIKGGANGGAFSLDAFKDIFAEVEEQFAASLSPTRSKEFKRLSEEFNTFGNELQTALSVGPNPGESRNDFDARIDRLTDRFEGAKKLLADFYETVPKVNLDDLRASLLESFDPSVVNTFFQALSGSGLDTFDALATASDSTIIGILNRLGELGFPFQETSDEITRLNNQLSEITQDKEVSVKFNVSTGFADENAANVFGLLFGDATGPNSQVVITTGGLSSSEQVVFDRLSNRRKKGALSKSDREIYEALRKKAKG